MKKLRSTAQGLAALGRNGDSMLVHMQPREVEGLQALAAANGTSLTVNPQTGLPEAFSIGNFLSSLLPTAVGAITAPFLGPYGAVAAGMATGAAMNKENRLLGAVSGGLGAYGGSTIGSSLTSTGVADISKGAADAATNSAAQTASTLGATGASPVGIPLAPESQALVQSAGQTGAANYLATAPTSNLGVMGRGITALGNSSGRDAFVNAMGGANKVAYGVGAPLAMATLSGMEPTAVPQEEDKYDPYATLNLGYSSGLRLLAEGGDITEMPDPGSNPLQNAQDARNYGIGGLSYAKGGGVFGGSSLNLNTADAPPPNRFGSSVFLPSYFMGMPNRSTELNTYGNASNSQPYYEKFNMLNRNVPDMFSRSTQPVTTSNARPFYERFNMLNRTVPNMFDRVTQPVQAPPPGPFAQSTKPLFAKGGYLDGPGDGMSDSIPATIGDKQPARLADGEFVVPADVVSHLGNGSTKAGAQRLYAMMDKVRHARTGTKKQGKQIKPEKYVPA